MKELRVLTIWGAVVMGACSGSTNPDSGLSVSSTIDQSAFVSGQTVHITVSVKNNRSTELIITKLGCNGSGPAFRVTSSGKDDVFEAPTNVPGTCEFTVVAKVPPGGTYTNVLEWHGEESTETGYSKGLVSPGRYTLRGVFVSGGEVLAESAPLTVQVLAP